MKIEEQVINNLADGLNAVISTGYTPKQIVLYGEYANEYLDAIKNKFPKIKTIVSQDKKYPEKTYSIDLSEDTMKYYRK